ncbi:MAG TPA: tetratricopeptide repeat protein [Myxococcales bacterium]|nr:tetratricopeptide repeat protein [Myxococcales bacterium]
MKWLLPAAVLLAGCPRSAEQLLDHADQLEGSHHFAAALAGYRDALRRLGADDGPEGRPVRTRILAHLGDLCYLDMRDTRCAGETYRALLENYPDAPESYQARIHYAEMLRDRLGDLTGAIAQYKALVSAYPDRPGADGYQMQAVEGYFQLADYAQARTEARTLLDRFPQSPLAPQARLLLASCFELEGRRAEAIAAYQELIDRTPPGEAVSRAQLALAKLLELQGQDDRALEVLLACLKTYPDPLLIQKELARLQRKMADARRLREQPDAFDHAPGHVRKVAAAVGGDATRGEE